MTLNKQNIQETIAKVRVVRNGDVISGICTGGKLVILQPYLIIYSARETPQNYLKYV